METTQSTTDRILYSENNSVGMITLNRPDALNTFRVEDYSRLEKILNVVASSHHLRALIITGNGKAFSAGQDLSELTKDTISNTDLQNERLGQLQNLTRLMTSITIPTITAFNGFAVGFGLEIALACDFRIATADSYFMFPETQRGLLHTNGVLWLLPRLIGLAASKEMLLRGTKFDAQYGLKTGLISSIHPQCDLRDNALKLATSIAKNSKTSIQLTKDILRKTYTLSLEEMLQIEAKGFKDIMQSDDFQEGVSSFLEKRATKFQ